MVRCKDFKGKPPASSPNGVGVLFLHQISPAFPH